MVGLVSSLPAGQTQQQPGAEQKFIGRAALSFILAADVNATDFKLAYFLSYSVLYFCSFCCCEAYNAQVGCCSRRRRRRRRRSSSNESHLHLN